MNDSWIRRALIAVAMLTSLAPLSCVQPAWAYQRPQQRRTTVTSLFELRKDDKDDDKDEEEDDGDLQILEFAESVQMPSISLVELLAFQQGITGTAATEDLGATKGLTAPAVGPGVSVVRRDLPALWRVSVKGKKALRNLSVQYRVESTDGRTEYLSVAGSANDLVGVTLVPLLPQQVDRDGKRRTIEGGAQLLLDLSAVRKAGRYEGSITIVMNYL